MIWYDTTVLRSCWDGLCFLLQVLIDCSGPPGEERSEETGLARKRDALLTQLERRMALRTLVFCNTIVACRQASVPSDLPFGKFWKLFWKFLLEIFLLEISCGSFFWKLPLEFSFGNFLCPRGLRRVYACQRVDAGGGLPGLDTFDMCAKRKAFNDLVWR